MAEQIVANYQARMEGASERLVDAYEGYLVNFLNLLNQGEMDFNDKPLRKFLCLFVSDAEKKVRIHQWKYSKVGRGEILRVKTMVQEQFKGFNRDEVWHELIAILMDMANRYERRDEKSGFHNYMYQAFHFHVYRTFMGLISDPLVWNGDTNAGFSEGSSFRDSEELINREITRIDLQSALAVDESLDEINENWVNGLTCADVFLVLNPFERRILKMYYEDHMEDSEIAEELGCCRATVNRRRLKAKEKIIHGNK